MIRLTSHEFGEASKPQVHRLESYGKGLVARGRGKSESLYRF